MARIIAYAVANFAGLVSVAPGGTGIYEGLMIAVMVSAGVSAGVTIPVVIMYRVLNTLIQVPPGYYFALKRHCAKVTETCMLPETDIQLGVSEFVALLNQTLEYAYSGVVITGELPICA